VGAGWLDAEPSVIFDDGALLVVYPPSDPRLPASVIVAIGFASTLVVGAALTSLDRDGSPSPALVAMSAASGLVAWWCRPLASLLPGMLGWVMLDAIVLNQEGALRWDGDANAARIAILLAVVVGVSWLRALLLRLRCRVLIQEYAIAEP
jgi:hypothetical protein